MEFVQLGFTAAVVLGGLWALSKLIPAGGIAAISFLLIIAGNGITRICAVAVCGVALADLLGPRRIKDDESLLTCPKCGRKVSRESLICPRCETRLATGAGSAGITDPWAVDPATGSMVPMVVGHAGRTSPQFTLRRLFLLVAVAAVASWIVACFRTAQYAAVQSAYGLQRYTRQEAEAVAGRPLPDMPDSEFKKSSDRTPP